MSWARVVVVSLALVPAAIGFVASAFHDNMGVALDNAVTALWVFSPLFVLAVLITRPAPTERRPRPLIRGAPIIACCLAQGALWLFSAPFLGGGDFEAAQRYVARMDLYNVTAQEEIYFSDHQTYSADLDSLGVVPSDGVSVEIEADSMGWSARTTHRAQPTFSCVVYEGRVTDPLTTLRGSVPERPGQHVCHPTVPRGTERALLWDYYRALRQRSVTR
jgi:hypothetical protein